MADIPFEQRGDTPFEMKRKGSFSLMTQKQRVPRGFEEVPATSEEAKSRLWRLMEQYIPTDEESIQKGIINHVEYTLAKPRMGVLDYETMYRATAYSVRDRLIEGFHDTNQFYNSKDPKRCYYLSLEFLMGRSLQNALVSLDVENNYKNALERLGFQLENLYEYEHDAALGNGGLGRLAACFLDSMATLAYPCWGYGIRYTYGIFEQLIVDGRQVEHPDYWLVQDNPFEIHRNDVTYAVRFGGYVERYNDNGTERRRWKGGQIVQAVAYDNPIPGFDTNNVNNLRLWRSAPQREFDFKSFDSGDYLKAVADRQEAECISSVLYPNDNTMKGKELRLRQQYFFVCASVQDALRRFTKYEGRDWKDLPKKLTLQLNDTHPTIAIPELMRILIDVEKLEWAFAFDLVRQCVNFTCHTVLPEAHEKWPVKLLAYLLPRHLEIINDINWAFIQEAKKAGMSEDAITKMSIYQEGETKMIRMSNLAVIGSHRVNGVAAIHTELIRRDLFPDFCTFYKKAHGESHVLNVTNGVTPRRWVWIANRPLGMLISEGLNSDSWLQDYSSVESLQTMLEDKDFVEKWRQVKHANKVRFADWVKRNCNVELDPNMLFDVQVKRIHEYKRQLLNALYIVHRFLWISSLSEEERVKQVQPRAIMIGGKAAPGYRTAKIIIKFITTLADVINNTPGMSKWLRVVFLPNYNVSSAQIIIPGTDLTQQISTAGTEASGTSNMKFVMNGSLICGTMDGSTVEIHEDCGSDVMFLFGAEEAQIGKIRDNAKNGRYPIDGRLQAAFNWIRKGISSDGRANEEFIEIVNNLCNNGYGNNGDYYLLIHDFPSYCDAQAAADKLYKDDNDQWHRRCIHSVSHMGKFTSDRTVNDYAKFIWDIKPIERPTPSTQLFDRVGSPLSSGSTAPNTQPVSAVGQRTTAAPRQTN